MHFLQTIVDFILHLDEHLASIISQYGAWTHGLLFLIIFCETGLVVTPFLPGDSLLFAAGAFAALGSLRIGFLYPLLLLAAIGGDNLNYWIGYHLGPKIFVGGTHRWLRKEYLDRTHRFFEKYGKKAIILARFVPIVRTFSPFVAGLGRMPYRTFLAFDIGGGLAWISLFLFGGYFFGNVPAVKNHFSVVIIAIVLISLLPAVMEYLRHRHASHGSQDSPTNN